MSNMICTPQARCRRWRHCDHCARIRQARIANAAARLASISARLDWVTLSPIAAGSHAVVKSRAEFLQKVRPDGAVWTIEQAPTTGRLHCNILLPSHEPRRLTLSASHVVCDINEPRRIAAYISKREQMPSPENYPGRLYGTAGPLWHWLSSGGAHPLVQAATAQTEIDEAVGKHQGIPECPLPNQNEPLTLADYAEIARRHLPDILGGLYRRRPSSCTT